MPAEDEGWHAEGIDEIGKESQVFPCASKDRALGTSVAGQIDRKRSVTALQVPIDVVPVRRAVAGTVYQEHELTAWSINTDSRRQQVVHLSLSDLY